MRASLTSRALALAAITSLAASDVSAQDRLTGARSASGGLFVESYGFGDGLVQRAGADGEFSVVRSATQVVLPLAFATPVGDRWNLDVATLVTSGRATFLGAGGETTASLSGLGDVRVRATGRVRGDALLVTVGANLGTGRRELTGGQVAALGVLGAPALGSVTPAATAGNSATTGLVYAFQRAGWSLAAGGSVEVRGSYAPVAALAAGVDATTYDPGTALHLSLGADRFVREGALSLALTADVYTQDRLVAGSDEAATRVRLGPTIGLEAEWRAPTTTFRELVVFAAERYRAAFTREGETVDGSSANYFSAGARAAYPVAGVGDLSAGLELWRHSGLSVEQSLVTAATTSAALSVGVQRRVGAYAVQPYLRLRTGTVDTRAGSANVRGVGLGVNVGATF
jgi:hypothetical protein